MMAKESVSAKADDLHAYVDQLRQLTASQWFDYSGRCRFRKSLTSSKCRPVKNCFPP